MEEQLGDPSQIMMTAELYATALFGGDWEERVDSSGVIVDLNGFNHVYNRIMEDSVLSSLCSPELLWKLNYKLLERVLEERMESIDSTVPELCDSQAGRERLIELLGAYGCGHLDGMPLLFDDIDSKSREALLRRAAELKDTTLMAVAEDSATTPNQIVSLLRRFILDMPEAEYVIAEGVDSLDGFHVIEN